jgi:hypothetical protein
MASPTPLIGAELIDCARANGNQGIEVAAQRCGYGEDIATFELELQKAGEHIGTEINSFADLIQTPKDKRNTGVVFAPESPTQL